MSHFKSLLNEYTQELKTTRNLLAVIPEADLAWKPHEKSMTLGGLARHIVDVVGWTDVIVNKAEYDMASEPPSPPATSVTSLLETFDKNAAEALKIFGESPDAKLKETWSLKMGGQTFFTLPKSQVLRTWVFSHLFHHRGQLTVYLRLKNVPLPSVYGPTADVQG